MPLERPDDSPTRWNRPAIVRVIKRAYRAGRDLAWSAVVRSRGELRRAAFAAVRPGLFGSWDRALHAAGLHADDIARYRAWDRTSVVAELRELAADRQPLSSGHLRKEDPGLHSAAVRYFGSFSAALRRAGIAPDRIRQRKQWSSDRIVAAIRRRLARGLAVTGTVVRRDDPALYGAAIRHLGSYTAARQRACSGL